MNDNTLPEAPALGAESFNFAVNTHLVITSLDFVCLEKKMVIEIDGGQHGQ
jgi:very-short-patch-repair endonuclease